MKIETQELTGIALDFAVAECEHPEWFDEGYMDTADVEALMEMDDGNLFSPSTDWAQGGPIIERERITLTHQGTRWGAQTDDDLFAYGSTPLIAAMRCYVASISGEEIEVPDELL